MPNVEKLEVTREAPAFPKETPFYIPAVDAPARPRRNLKRGDMFVIFDSHGDIGASAGGGDGLFHSDTRILSHLELLIAGSHSLLLASTVDDENLKFHVDLTNPDIYEDDRIVLPKDTVHIARTTYLGDHSVHQRISLMNHGADSVDLTFTLSFASDFADLFEVRGLRRPRRGQAFSEVVNACCARLRYCGLDHVTRRAVLHFEPEPTSLQSNIATYTLKLAPHETRAIFLTLSTHEEQTGAAASFLRGLRRLKREHKAITDSVASVETENSAINEVVCRSMADLYMLLTKTEDGLYPYAGIPWYSTTFGRDGIITALETLWLDPAIAAGVLKRLARLQATEYDSAVDAAPGKILHEMRAGEMAALGEIPFRQYYGTVDATPLFVILAGAYGDRTGDWSLVREIWPAIDRALGWIDDTASSDSKGFVTHSQGAKTGLTNQGWKDSYDSVFHADGRLAEGPIALVEVQGYCYAARIAAANCARALGFDERADALLVQAEDLRQRFEASFWLPDLGFYALALDGHHAPCRVRTSNAGQALWSGIVQPDRGRAVGAALLRSEFFSGWGIRTVANSEVRYNPMSYHNGSIWPHDNALIAAGLARVGMKDGIVTIFEAMMRATSYLDQRRIPELYCGFRRRSGRGPTIYPAACSPQAWSAASPFSLVESMLGLEFRPQDNEIRLNNPVVPQSAGTITLRNVALGNASADFTVRRSAGGVTFDLLKKRGNLRVSLVLDQ